jgi:hypothetical protein
MTGKKKEILHLIDEAKNHTKPVDKDIHIARRYLFLMLALLLAAVIAGFFKYFEIQNEYRDLISDSLKRAEQLEREKEFVAAKELYETVSQADSSSYEDIEKDLSRLDKKIQHRREVLAYRDKVQIKNLNLWRKFFELKVSGSIINTGKRPLNEIELTIYCLNEDERPVCEEKITAVSSDGKPLKRHQRRKFSFFRKYDEREFSLEINSVPESVREVQVIVTDIDFADTD